MGLELKEKKNNGKRVIDFCAERGLSVSNTYFEHKSLQKYTSMSRGQDGVEIMSITDPLLVKEVLLRYEQDLRSVRGMGRSLSDHHVDYVKLGCG